MTLENCLASLHVERQAYHGGTFVRNYVQKLLKVIVHIKNLQAHFKSLYMAGHTYRSNP